MIPSLEEFLASTGWSLKDKKKRTWFCAAYGTVDEEKAIALAYQHHTIAGF